MVANKDKSPETTIKDFELILSDSGQIQAKSSAPLMNRYDVEKPYVEWPKGIKVLFYDTSMNVDARLSANYAISYEKDKIMIAKNNVIVVNVKGEQLNTEHLVWDQRKRIITSDVFVTITTKDEVLYGQGMEADDQFYSWKIKRPTGVFNIKK